MPGVTRRMAVLYLLRSRRGRWVPLPEIMRAGGAQFGARILELGADGHRIENRLEHRNGETLSWYLLLELGDAAPMFAEVR